MTLFLAIVICILVIGLVCCVGFVCWAAKCVWRESVARARSADETVGKNLPIFMQTANALSETTDRRVRERIRIINSVATGAPEAADVTAGPTAPINEMPPMWTSNADAEQRELDREAQRLIREGADPARDVGIGQDVIPPMPVVRTETL